MEPAPLVPLDLPVDFAALPSEERSRVLAAGHAMTQYVYRRAVAIVIGAPRSRGTAMRNGSGFIIQQGGAYFLGTAWHVVAYWMKIHQRVKDLLFQVAGAMIDPEKALSWKDEGRDLAFLSLSPEQVTQIPAVECESTRGWPPPRPQSGDYVLISGFPSVIRELRGPRRVQLNALSNMLQVTRVGDDYGVCQFFRENWVSFDSNGVPPPGTDLGGISGAPVLLVGKLDYPLIGVVFEFSRDFELLYFRHLASAPTTFPARPATYRGGGGHLPKAG